MAEMAPPLSWLLYIDMRSAGCHFPKRKVEDLNDKLEQTGYNCWMDIRKTGARDTLLDKTSEGIKDA